MRLRNVKAITAIAVLVAGAILVPDYCTKALGDLNADSRFDVMDLQLFVAKVLVEQDAHHKPVTILDLQRAVAQSQCPTKPCSDLPQRRPAKGCLFAYQMVQKFEPVSVQATVEPPLVVMPHQPQRERRHPVIFSSHEERYLLRLTPHAPPHCA